MYKRLKAYILWPMMKYLYELRLHNISTYDKTNKLMAELAYLRNYCFEFKKKNCVG